MCAVSSEPSTQPASENVSHGYQVEEDGVISVSKTLKYLQMCADVTRWTSWFLCSVNDLRQVPSH